MSLTLSSAGIEPGFLVSTAWLSDHLDDPTLRVFDCSATMVVDPVIKQRVQPERAAFEAGHIPGARFIDIDAQLSDPDHQFHLMLPPPAAFRDAVEALGIGDDSLVVIYSTGSIWWATRIWWMLRVYGFTNAHVLDGGLARWRAEGRALAQGDEASVPRGDFTVAPVRPFVAARADVEQVVRGIEPTRLTRLVNALRPSQYSGEELPRKGRPGHIPGSINIPAASLLDADSGRFLDDDGLRERFAAAGIDEQTPVIAYCGGGVSASLVVFALMKLGHANVRLYDASLGEWGSAPELPMQVE
ncbi:sulfurtransferase [Pandoraea fibrosis]|uniref:Sulfurtransferase n=1 Tax=Pandoraea fibrosis TaxID=1891094 RepID=A0ABX6HV80_9BURK|nr:sulfurtransferase [Pandoraea fibrosis]QHE91632.1 sulfurtransferase [Pandoraea fibrosis]QHF14810.1 sulfurtransferase [Pandoraea fibrosis]